MASYAILQQFFSIYKGHMPFSCTSFRQLVLRLAEPVSSARASRNSHKNSLQRVLLRAFCLLEQQSTYHNPRSTVYNYLTSSIHTWGRSVPRPQLNGVQHGFGACYFASPKMPESPAPKFPGLLVLTLTAHLQTALPESFGHCTIA